MSILMRLFGTEYRVRFTASLKDGRTLTSVASIKCYGVDLEEIRQHLEKLYVVETGHKLESFVIVGIAKA